MYIPVDTGICIKRVVDSIRPQIFVTAETELWPVIFQALKKAGARILILNGRISNDSFKGYSRISFLMKKVLSMVDFLYMQTREDAEKIISIGADPHKVAVMGNFKFDILFNDSPAVTWQNRIKGDILLAASTHKGEEEIILDAYKLIRSRMRNREKNKDSTSRASDLKLILAPRHPERFAEVEALLLSNNFKYIKRTEIDSIQDADVDKADIILLDTVGELPLLFCRVTVGYIGGSLVPKGGHNIMEPGYWSVPTIFGPHMDNFPVAEEFLNESAAIEVRTAENIADAVIDLIQNEEKALRMGKAAKKIVDRNTGAVKKAAELVRGFLGTV
jgi:3-deoxy-D-manno-octulosonic-acid transferase